jgi:choline dehydrogenase-like flavoprotein
MLGGRTNHWGRISLRNGPYDFKPYSRDGLGIDWPIGYDDLAPYYDKVEMLVGIFGSNEGMENTPNSSPGVLLPPPAARAGELLAAAARSGRSAFHRADSSRGAHASSGRGHNSSEVAPRQSEAQRILAKAMRERGACFWGNRVRTRGARSRRTTNRPRCISRQHWRRGISTSSRMRWCGRFWGPERKGHRSVLCRHDDGQRAHGAWRA